MRRLLLAPLLLAIASAIASNSSCGLRLNCGGGPLPSGVTGDRLEFHSSTAAWVGNYTSLPAGRHASVFDSHSWTAADELVYVVAPPPAARYDVRLQFAETWPPAGEVGARVFNILVNGDLKTRLFDAWTQAGRKMRHRVEHLTRGVEVVDGVIEIRLVRVKGNPFISGIEVFPACGNSSKGGE